EVRDRHEEPGEHRAQGRGAPSWRPNRAHRYAGTPRPRVLTAGREQRRTQADTEDAVPTYEYRCKECGDELEVVQSFTDDALVTCPSCGKDSLRKVFRAVGISFKGSGFYKTDSRGSS